MKIETRAQGFRTTMALSAHVEREVRKSLSGVRPCPDAVLASLSDVNGPRGGDDKRCQLRGRLPRAGEVVASAAHADMYQAIAQAADRFCRALVHRSAVTAKHRGDGGFKPDETCAPPARRSTVTARRGRRSNTD